MLLVFLSFQIYSQQQNKDQIILEYDNEQNRILPTGKTLKQNKGYKVKITGLNTGITSISLKGIDKELTATAPEALNILGILSETGFDLSNKSFFDESASSTGIGAVADLALAKAEDLSFLKQSAKELNTILKGEKVGYKELLKTRRAGRMVLRQLFLETSRDRFIAFSTSLRNICDCEEDEKKIKQNLIETYKSFTNELESLKSSKVLANLKPIQLSALLNFNDNSMDNKSISSESSKELSNLKPEQLIYLLSFSDNSLAKRLGELREKNLITDQTSENLFNLLSFSDVLNEKQDKNFKEDFNYLSSIGFKEIYLNKIDSKDNFVDLKKELDKIASEKVDGLSKKEQDKIPSEPIDGLSKEELESLSTAALNDELKKVSSDYLSKVKSSVNYIQTALKVIEHEITGTLEKFDDDILNSKLIEKYVRLKGLNDDLNIKKLQEQFKYVSAVATAKDSHTSSKKYYLRRDLLDVQITVQDAYSKDTLQFDSIPVYSKGTWKPRIRFSTGLFYNEVVEQSYFLGEANEETGTRLVLEEESESFDVAVGAQIHLGLMTTAWSDINFNLGIATSPLDGKTRYLIGGGFLTGFQRKFGFSMGVAFSRINVLSNAVVNGMVPMSTETVPTAAQIESGVFFGLTYNLSRTAKK